MATNAIGSGTVNVSVNLLKSEKNILGKLALADDRSLSDFMRRMVVVGLRSYSPASASGMEEARRLHNEQMLLKI